MFGTTSEADFDQFEPALIWDGIYVGAVSSGQ
jgi:hypothetical protein